MPPNPSAVQERLYRREKERRSPLGVPHGVSEDKAVQATRWAREALEERDASSPQPLTTFDRQPTAHDPERAW